MNNDDIDPRGLIAESYRIEGITSGECRSIFLDWALSAPDGDVAKGQIATLLERHAGEPTDHPMTTVLKDALVPAVKKGRRGGAAARRRG